MIRPEMLHLKGLVLTPKLKDRTVVSISNNFDVFMKKNPALKYHNIVIKLLKIMCNDANNGDWRNPNFYISDFRSRLQHYVFWVLLGSHVPMLFLLFFERSPFAEILKFQVCCYILIYVLEMIIQYKISHFTKIFYGAWYDKILNFDLLSVAMIRNDVDQIKKLSNSHDLLEAVYKFTESNAKLSTDLTSHSKVLSEKIDELLHLQDKTKSINTGSILLSLDDSISKYREINAHFQVISEHIRDSVENLTKLSKNKKDEINTINKNTEILLDLREQFKTYQSETFKTELTQLQMITASLENNVSKAFLSIDKTITQNFERLESGYDKFYDMCKALSESVSDKYEEKTVEILSLLSNDLMREFINMRKETEKITSVIEGTSQATKLLCETIYNFTQYTESPNFMKKVGNFFNFSNRLKDAAEKLISYEKLTSLGDLTTGKQSEEDKTPETIGQNNKTE
jgi:hypothetical protein